MSDLVVEHLNGGYLDLGTDHGFAAALQAVNVLLGLRQTPRPQVASTQIQDLMVRWVSKSLIRGDREDLKRMIEEILPCTKNLLKDCWKLREFSLRLQDSSGDETLSKDLIQWARSVSTHHAVHNQYDAFRRCAAFLIQHWASVGIDPAQTLRIQPSEEGLLLSWDRMTGQQLPKHLTAGSDLWGAQTSSGDWGRESILFYSLRN